MFQRKELKEKSKRVVKKNYWLVVFVCLVMMFFAGAYDNLDNEPTIEYEISYSDKTSNYEITNEILQSIFKTDNVENLNKHENVTNGVFKFIFNLITKFERILFNFVKNILNIFDPAKAGIAIGIFIVIVKFTYQIFIAEPLLVGESRFFLETRLYPQTSINRIFYPFKKGKYTNIVKASFRKRLYLFLWSFTIIGLVIKNYSYRMVSYIMAENPNISSKEAILLSRKMMEGYKFETFKLDLSFIFWHLLDSISFGIAGIILVNPYYKATDCELYIYLKEQYLIKKRENYELLNDENLIKNIDNKMSYPGIKKREKIDASKKFNYYKRYSITSMVLFFFSFSVVGFIWEVVFNFVQYGNIVKRGALLGPWLPIYGSGCVIVLLLLFMPKKLKKVTDNPILTFLLVMFMCTAIEYGTSIYLELVHGARWWDYTGYFLNINGRVCLEGILFFGIGGTACIYFIAPFLDRVFSKISKNTRTIMCIVLVTLIACDFVYSHFHPNMDAGIIETRQIEKYNK